MTIEEVDTNAVALAPDHELEVLAVETARPRSRRATDYRLRGLDLEAQGRAEPRVRRARITHPSQRRHRRRRAVQLTAVVAVAVGVATLLHGSVVQRYMVDTASMVPTIQKGTGVVVLKPTWLRGPVERGDIVVVHQPAGSNCAAAGDAGDVVKRVIGMPGETISSVGQSIYIDGSLFDDKGWYNQPFGHIGTSKIPRTKIPPGSYFVMGDNRTDTCDSRAFGPVRGSAVVGEVIGTATRNGHPYVHGI